MPLTESEKIRLGQAKRRLMQVNTSIDSLVADVKANPKDKSLQQTISVLRREQNSLRTEIRELELKQST